MYSFYQQYGSFEIDTFREYFSEEIHTVYISLGQACPVKSHLDSHFGSKETLFFDWLITDMNSVCTLFESYQSLDTLLHVDTIKMEKKDHIYAHFSKLSGCSAIHDLYSLDCSLYEKEQFVDKYKRRFQRIINFIQNQTYKIYFIRHGGVTDDLASRFVKAILHINPMCQFKLVSLDENHTLLQTEYIKSYDLNKYKSRTHSASWLLEHYKWSEIFKSIPNEI